MTHNAEYLKEAILSNRPEQLNSIFSIWETEDVQAAMRELLNRETDDLKAFTMAAMQGLCANSVLDMPVLIGQTEEGVLAQAAIKIARATLSELSKQQQG